MDNVKKRFGEKYLVVLIFVVVLILAVYGYYSDSVSLGPSNGTGDTAPDYKACRKVGISDERYCAFYLARLDRCGNGVKDPGEACDLTVPGGDGECMSGETCNMDKSEVYNFCTCENTCFLAETLVSMVDGTYKNIEDIKVGEKVISYDLDKGAIVEGIVTKTFKHEDARGYLEIDGIKVTSNHPFWVNNEWKMAGEIKAGDSLMNQNGAYVSVKEISKVDGLFTVYNLEVESQNNYFAGGVLVHNKLLPCDKDDVCCIGGSSDMMHLVETCGDFSRKEDCLLVPLCDIYKPQVTTGGHLHTLTGCCWNGESCGYSDEYTSIGDCRQYSKHPVRV